VDEGDLETVGRRHERRRRGLGEEMRGIVGSRENQFIGAAPQDQRLVDQDGHADGFQNFDVTPTVVVAEYGYRAVGRLYCLKHAFHGFDHVPRRGAVTIREIPGYHERVAGFPGQPFEYPFFKAGKGIEVGVAEMDDPISVE
jgi:hypothetical protein